MPVFLGSCLRAHREHLHDFHFVGCTMDLRSRLEQIERALRGRQLVYFGTRGADAEALLKVENLSAVFSLVAPLAAGSVREISLETETKERVDLDSYNIDFDNRLVVGELRRQLLDAFTCLSVLVAYRPCAFLSSAWFPRSDRVQYLGLFHEMQACFEHKPWVESQLSALGVRVLPWRYWADNEMDLIREWAATQPLVLRSNRTDGGVGVRLVHSPEEVDDEWPSHCDGFLAASPYFVPSIPLNVNACVYADGAVTLHGPSLQLIGLEGMTGRRFGYCGNDFAGIAHMDAEILYDLEEITKVTGRWLHANGYRGAFGIDALLHDGRLYLTEVNPRFQGSSLMSSRIDRELGRPDIFLEHIAAFLGLPAQPSIRLHELAAAQPPLAHIICHNTGHGAIVPTPGYVIEHELECRLVPSAGVAVRSEAIAFEIIVRGSVTADGMSLCQDLRQGIQAVYRDLYMDSSDTV
jgi:hypothetical protein